jgi:hypothetical protein
MRWSAAAVLLLAACRGQPTSPTAGLEVTASVAPAAARIGQTVSITVLLINHTDQLRTIETNQCGMLFRVMTLDGAVVGPAGRICAAFSRPKTLVPGEQYVFTDQWSGDATGGGPDGPLTFVKPGAYLVRGLPALATSVNLPASVQVTP